jgi:hypothetical protein
MTLASRLARARKRLGEPPDVGLATCELDAEGKRWGALLDQVGENLGKDAGEVLLEHATEAFGRLMGLVLAAERGQSDWPPAVLAARVAEARRWPKAMTSFLLATPKELRDRVVTSGFRDPMGEYDREGWLTRWVWDLVNLRSRVPPGIDPEAFGQVVLIHLERRREMNSFHGVCPRTGLRVPRVKRHPGDPWKVLPGKVPCQGPPPWYDCPEFFSTCPGCGALKYGILQCQLASEPANSQDWPALAARELAP